jgi:hypothetical protein
MTERDYILATDSARLMAAIEALRNVMPSERVPESEMRQVLRTLIRWNDATFAAIEIARDDEEEAHPRPRVSLRALGELVGCSHAFLSQARAGKVRIRRSWAEKIADVAKDMPATTQTWPAGWADEE